MTMKATFQNTVDILVKAHLNDTLKHGNCSACAVGNIIAYSCGFAFRKDYRGEPEWDCDVNPMDWFLTTGTVARTPETDKTGYDKWQLGAIEAAFETSDPGKSNDEKMFNGLMAVVDVLAEIHGIDLTEKETAKGLFVKVPL